MRNAKPLLFISLLLAGGAASAQTATAAAQAASVTPAASGVRVSGYAGPSAAAHYKGPTEIAQTTVKQLLAEGHDDQYARLSGKLVRHVGGHRYVLADATGELEVEIAPKHFPAGITIDEKTDVVLTGEFEKKHHRKPQLEVKRIELISATGRRLNSAS